MQLSGEPTSVRILLWIPLIMAVTAAAAWAVLRGLTARAPLAELLAACAITTLAAEAAMAPLVLARGAGAGTGTMSQAALLGTLVHLFLAITLAGAAYLMRLFADRGMFLYLLVAFYWVSLVMVVIAAVRAIRYAEQQQQPPPQHHKSAT
jgi:hypothetical protein